MKVQYALTSVIPLFQDPIKRKIRRTTLITPAARHSRTMQKPFLPTPAVMTLHQLIIIILVLAKPQMCQLGSRRPSPSFKAIHYIFRVFKLVVLVVCIGIVVFDVGEFSSGCAVAGVEHFDRVDLRDGWWPGAFVGVLGGTKNLVQDFVVDG